MKSYHCMFQNKNSRCKYKSSYTVYSTRFTGAAYYPSENPINSSVLITTLKQCGKTRELDFGRKIHQNVVKHHINKITKSCESHSFVCNCLVNMYSKCGSMHLARGVFNGMSHKDVITWTCLIQGYAENGESSIALDLFNIMDCKPDDVTCVAAIKACAALDVEKALAVHQLVKDLSLDSDVVVMSALVDTYRRLGKMKLAREVFEQMSLRNVVAWTCLIQGYVEREEFLVALDLFHTMDCEPDEFTYVAALKACSGIAVSKIDDREKVVAVEKGLAIHKQLKSHGWASSKVVASALINMYSKLGRMFQAREVFDGMISKDVVLWTCLIRGYSENGQIAEALKVFDSMNCAPDCVTYTAVLKALSGESESERQICLERCRTIHERIKISGMSTELGVAHSLIEAYGKLRVMPLARDVFDRMTLKDVVTWNSIIQGYVTNGRTSVALELFDAMDCEPDEITFVAALKACAGEAVENEVKRERFLSKGRAIHEQVKEREVEFNIVVANTLIDMYGKCGVEESARDVFNRMPSKDVVTWTNLILGYVENGKSSEALEVFKSMDIEPDHVTYIAVLKACTASRTGRESERQLSVDKGFKIHQEIRERGFLNNIAVSNALISMYRSFGLMEVAGDVFRSMKRRDVVSWTSLILGYVENGESSRAVEAFKAMDCQPDHITYVALLGVCGDLADLLLGRRIHGTVCRLGLEEDIVVATALLDLYGRCGCMTRAVQTFNSLCRPEVVSWNALIAGHSSLGDSSQMFDAVKRMCEAGLRLDAVTFVSILAVCSHAGMLKEGEFYFKAMREHVVTPTVSHYNCMIDMLGRANRLAEAVSLVNSMPFRSNEVTWTTLLGEAGKLI